MSDKQVKIEKPFDIYGFDVELLDFDTLLNGLNHYRESKSASLEDWEIFTVNSSADRSIYQLEPHDREKFPSLAVKVYDGGNATPPQREFQILTALYNFGVIIAPRPFYFEEKAIALDCPVLITEWARGESLQQVPSVEDEEMWHRIMAMLGIPNNLPFAKYASEIPMMGRGPQSPKDVFNLIENTLKTLDENHPQFEQLSVVFENAQQSIADEWNSPPNITLNHLDPAVHHFVYDGHHLRIIGFDKADWADTAFAVGQLCAHPDFEEVSSNHWVWYRWELARLTKDETLTARATTYANLLQVYWAIKLTVDGEHIETETKNSKRLLAQRDRYLKRATRLFSGK